jgi:hypothetical protein
MGLGLFGNRKAKVLYFAQSLKFSIVRPTLLYLFILIGMSSCYDIPIPEQSIDEFTIELQEMMNTGDVNKLDEFFNVDLFVTKIKAYKALPKMERRFFKAAVKQEVLSTFEAGEIVHLCTTEVEKDLYILNFTSTDPEVFSYIVIYVYRKEDGKLHIYDFHNLWFGGRASKNWDQFMRIQRRNPHEFESDLKTIDRARKLMGIGEYDNAYKQLSQLSNYTLHTPVVLTLGVQISSFLDLETYQKELRKLKSSLSDPKSLKYFNIYLLDLEGKENEVESEISSLEEFICNSRG